MLTEYVAACPYCGERFSTTLDMSGGSQEYIEDCQICCRPIIFSTQLDAVTDQTNIQLRRDDD